jgi:hypothetical protein
MCVLQLPVIIFTFSKRVVEQRAEALSKLDLLSAREKSGAHLVLQRALLRLHEADRDLPQIRRIADLLSRGIGVHHGGLLPLIKEVRRPHARSKGASGTYLACTVATRLRWWRFASQRVW